MKTIKQEYLINSTSHNVWEGLTNPDLIKKWSGENAVMDDKKGTNFKLWNGDIFGKNIEIIIKKKLVQQWYGGDWEKPSIVTFKLEDLGSKTKVTLIHEDVPKKEYKDIEQGWKDYYMNPLKKLLEK